MNQHEHEHDLNCHVGSLGSASSSILYSKACYYRKIILSYITDEEDMYATVLDQVCRYDILSPGGAIGYI